jgi:hypothetical protein
MKLYKLYRSASKIYDKYSYKKSENITLDLIGYFNHIRIEIYDFNKDKWFSIVKCLIYYNSQNESK